MHNNFWLTVFCGGFFCLSALAAQADDFNPAGVIVESLPELSLNTIGTQKTVNPNLWAQTEAKTLLSLVSEAGLADLTPAQQKLVTHLLTLDVTGTSFLDETGALGDRAFLTERLRALFHLGEWENVLNLIALIPETDISDEIAEIKRNTLLLKGDVKEVCSFYREKESSKTVDQLRIACFVAQEEKEKAVLSYDIYQEKYEDSDSLFTALAENALREIPTPLPKEARLQPADVYLVPLNKTNTLNWALQPRAMRITVADLPATDIPLRIELAEKSGLSLEAMKKIYRLPLFKPDLNNNAVKRAWLHQQILTETDENQKMKRVKEWIDLIKKDHLFVPLAPVISDVFNTLEAEKSAVDLAYAAVQAYGLENNIALAEPWFNLLRKSDTARSREQLFLLTPLWQSLGGGYPDNLPEKMNHYCGVKPLAACEKLKALIPEKMYRINDFDVSPREAESVLSETEKTTRLGEVLLRATLNINQQKELQKSYAVIREVAQPNQRDAVLREEMIFE